MTLQVQLQEELLHDLARDILHGWRQFLSICQTTPKHVVLDLGCTRSIGSRAAIRRFQKHALYYGITTRVLHPCNKSFVFATSEMETCWESCIVHLPSKPPCSTRVECALKQVMYPSHSHISKWKNWEMTIELNPKGDKITCPAFGQYSTPAECEMNTTMETLLVSILEKAVTVKMRADVSTNL